MSGPSIEIQFAQKLAGNEVTTRDKALKKLKKWLRGRVSMSPEEMLRLWKGLYYCFWMSDKPLIQEELSEKISQLFGVFGSHDLGLNFMSSFLKTLNREWFGLDRWRLDKFLMLSRRMLRGSLKYLYDQGWTPLPAYMKIIREEILEKPTGNDLGFRLHFIEIFFEEVAKVGGRDFELCDTFLEAFLSILAFGKESRIRDHVVQHVFHHLIKQSDIALAYEAFKRGELDSDAEESDEGEEEEDIEMEDEEREEGIQKECGEEGPLDPRAGKVSISLNQLILNFSHVGDLLFEYGSKKQVKKVNRECLYSLSKEYKSVSEGSYPFAIEDNEEELHQMKKDLDEVDVFKLAANETASTLKDIQQNYREKKILGKLIKGKEFERQESNGDAEEEELMDDEEEESSGEEEEVANEVDLGSEDSFSEDNDMPNDEEEEDGTDSLDEDGNTEEDLVSEASLEEEEDSGDDDKENIAEEEESDEEEEEEIQVMSSGLKRKRSKVTPSAPPTKKVKRSKLEEEEPVLLNIKLKGKSKKFKMSSDQEILFAGNDDWGGPEVEEEASLPKTPIHSRLLPHQTASESKAQSRSKQRSRKLSLPASKRVNFVMTKNQQQSLVQHHKSIVSSPEIPFLPGKKPKQGVLKVKGDTPSKLPAPNPKLLARNTILNAKSKAAKLFFRSGMNGLL